MGWSSRGGRGGERRGAGDGMAGGAERETQRVAGGSVAYKEDERVGQGGGWATLLLSCSLLGFEIY